MNDTTNTLESGQFEILRSCVYRYEPLCWIDTLFICASMAPDILKDTTLDMDGCGLDKDNAIALGKRIDLALEDGTLNVHFKRRDESLDQYGCLDGCIDEDGFFDLSGEPIPEYSPLHEETILVKKELADFASFLKCCEGFCVSTHHFSLVARSNDFEGMA